MSDYISREAALEVFCRWCGICPKEKQKPLECDDILGNVLHSLPAADVRPVVRGEWLEFVGSAYHGVDDDGEVKWRDVSIFHCDKCGRKTVVKENFCPSCGADMREEDDRG